MIRRPDLTYGEMQSYQEFVQTVIRTVEETRTPAFACLVVAHSPGQILRGWCSGVDPTELGRVLAEYFRGEVTT